MGDGSYIRFPKKWSAPMWLRLLALLPAGLMAWSAAAFAETRIALVIGNSTYKTVTVLPNPANDAKLFTEFLKAAQFEVVEAPNLSQADLRRAIREFAIQVAQKGPDTVSLIYYAGHGLQVDGENYLVPVDADIKRESDVAIEAVRLNDLMTALEATPSKMRIVILDACRNNPFSDINRTTGRGLAIVDAPTGSVVSYSTAPGMTAADGAGANSPFTAALVQVGRTPNLPVEQAFKQVRLAVHKTTDGLQTPWESTSLTSDFSFFGTAASGPQAAAAANSPKSASNAAAPRSKPPGYWRKQLQPWPELGAFELVIGEDDPDAYSEFLALFPASPLASQVRGLLERRLLMMAWYTAVLVNTPLAYQAFLDRYPSSDLTATARRLRDRARSRALSANLARDMMAAAGPQNVPASTPPAVPASLPASLPVAPVCSCPAPPEPREPREPRNTRKKEPPPKRASTSPPPRHPPPVVQAGDPGPGVSGLPIGIGIGMGGFGRRGREPSSGGHPSSTRRPPPSYGRHTN
jgi:hypothetical protein